MIFWFSGTGNSRWAAQQLAQATGERTIDIAKALASGQHEWTLKAEERVGFVMPVYAWGVPKIVREFLPSLTINGYKADRNYCYALFTCGDDAGYADQLLERYLQPRLKLNGAFTLIMPNCYVCLSGYDTDPAEVEQRKLLEAPERLQFIAESIGRRRDTREVIRGKHAYLKSHVLRPLFDLLYMSPKPFHALPERCIHCGMCARVCPLHNIVENGDTVRWGRHCTMCLACYHHCPVQAVQYGKGTLKKHQYLHPNKQAKL